MKPIRILSESAALGNRLRDILYQADYADIAVTDLNAVSDLTGASFADTSGILIIYAKSHIPDIIQFASGCTATVILLLEPDSYAMYLDRARHAGIRLLLMPVAPYMLLDALTSS